MSQHSPPFRQMDAFPINETILERATRALNWHRQELKNASAKVLRVPERNAWKTWNDTRLWCSFFFSIASPGGSETAREYLRYIENGSRSFELTPPNLLPLSAPNRLKAIWEFGTGRNFLKKRLGRFFSKPMNIGAPNRLETNLAHVFAVLARRGFVRWLRTLDLFEDDRVKAKALEFLPGAKLKVSRDFLNNIGMTDSLIPLDVHILHELATNWGWKVPSQTPTDRGLYEEIEDSVRVIAAKVSCTVVELDKAIFSAQRASQGHSTQKKGSPKPARRTGTLVSNDTGITPLSAWQRLYAPFEAKRKNTVGWGRKKRHARRLLAHFGGIRIPIEALALRKSDRKDLSRALFGKDTEYNYVTYTLCMAVHLGVLEVQGNFLVLIRPELLED